MLRPGFASISSPRQPKWRIRSYELDLARPLAPTSTDDLADGCGVDHSPQQQLDLAELRLIVEEATGGFIGGRSNGRVFAAEFLAMHDHPEDRLKIEGDRFVTGPCGECNRVRFPVQQNAETGGEQLGMRWHINPRLIFVPYYCTPAMAESGNGKSGSKGPGK